MFLVFLGLRESSLEWMLRKSQSQFGDLFVASAGAGRVTVVLLKVAQIHGFELRDGAS